MKLDKPSLEDSWKLTAERSGIAWADGGAIFNGPCFRYTDPSRHYHDLRHVAAMLKTLAPFRDRCQDATALELAVWFHDAVYDSRRKDNEEEGAALAASVLSSAGVTQATVDRVAGLILATKTHQAAREAPDRQLLLDADLAVLGAPPAEYDAYSEAIRREYEWVAEADYRAGRARVLRGFLERDQLFGTDALSAALEGSARHNLQREIAWLTLQTSETT